MTEYEVKATYRGETILKRMFVAIDEDRVIELAKDVVFFNAFDAGDTESQAGRAVDYARFTAIRSGNRLKDFLE